MNLQQKVTAIGVLLLLVAVLLVVPPLGIFGFVGAGDRGFTETFGQISTDVYEPGVLLTPPFVTRLYTRSIRQQTHQGELEAY